ncbi:hypothetical protein [Aliamphritea spongicola]
MATRYEGNDKSKTDDLELVDRTTSSDEPFLENSARYLSGMR